MSTGPAQWTLGDQHRPGLRPERTRIVELYTAPPPGSTVICAYELGPVSPRTFAPAPGWSPGGHRIRAPLEYSRGPDKTRVYGGLRVADGQEVTLCVPSRNSEHYQRFLQQAETATSAAARSRGKLGAHRAPRTAPAARAVPARGAAPFSPRPGPGRGGSANQAAQQKLNAQFTST